MTKHLKKFLLGIFLITSTNLVWCQEAYLCIPTAISGFKFNSLNRSWEHARFRIGETKKILKKTNGKWEWKYFGEKYSLSECTSGGEPSNQDGFNSAGFLFCDVFGGHMKINKNTLRYIETYEVGFIDGKDKDGNTPSIEIGTCSPL